jgi:hypothetical protein
MLQLLHRPLARFFSSSTRTKMSVDLSLKDYDPVQVQLMGERCILVNEKDQVIGHESKKNCTSSFRPTACFANRTHVREAVQ